MAAKKAVGYVRVSRVGLREGDRFISPDLQQEQIEAVARRESLEIVEVIQELDASGGDASRPGWNRAIEMVERGEVSGIAVWNFARFSRSVKDAVNALERIEGAGGRVWSATEDFGDGPAGRMVRTILLAVAENERARAAEGFQAAKASAVERGIHLAGRVPLGYRRGANRRLEVDPDAAPVAEGVFERKAQGWSHEAITRWVQEQGYDFTSTGVRYMLGNRTYRGEVRSGALVKENAHPPLVTEGLWRKCQGRGTQSQRTGRLAGRSSSAVSRRAPAAGAASDSRQAATTTDPSTTAVTGAASGGHMRGPTSSTASRSTPWRRSSTSPIPRSGWRCPAVTAAKSRKPKPRGTQRARTWTPSWPTRGCAGR